MASIYLLIVISFLLASSLISTATSTDDDRTPVTNQTALDVAIQDMQKANYFAFVMLINLVQSSSYKIATNITFLMPNDRILAKAVIPENNVLDFLLRHSIPSPLRFDHLTHFPTGSIVPSSEPEFMLKISNNGRRSFFLNDVKVISPDICVTSPLIKCHGIDRVLLPDAGTDSPPPPITMTVAPPPAFPPPGPLTPAPGGGVFELAPAATPQPAAAGSTHRRPKKSDSSCLIVGATLIVCLMGVLLLDVLRIM